MLKQTNTIKLIGKQHISTVITCALFIFLSALATAQNPYNVEIELTTASNSVNYKLPGKQFFPVYVPLGSEFFDEAWREGYVVLENGDRYENLNLKYNTFKDELITINDRTRVMVLLDKDAISEFGFYSATKNQRFVKMYFNKVPSGDHYFMTQHDGSLKYAIWYRTQDVATTPYRDKNGYLQMSEFEMSLNHYVCFPDNDFKKFKLNRRSLVLLFPDQKKEIRRMLRKERNRVKTISEATRAIEIIDREYFTK